MSGVNGKMSSSKVLLIFVLLGLASAIGEARNLRNELTGDSDSSSDTGSVSSNKAWSGKTLLNRRKRDASSSSMESAEIDLEATDIVKFFLHVGWTDDKLSVLSGFLDELADSDTNLTIVGWQNLHHDDGSVKEFRSIQFVIPTKPETAENGADQAAKETNDEDDEEDIDEDFGRLIPHTLVNKLREVFEPMEKMGIPAAAVFEEYNKAGEPEVVIYLDKTTLWANSEGFSVYNKTLVATQAEVDDFIKQIDTYHMKSVLKYDVAGKLTEDSLVSARFLGSVTETYEITDDILLESPEIVAKVWAKHPRDKVPKELANEFNSKWPAWQWRVIIDPSYYFISRDISVTLSIDNLDFDETSNISYFVYGRKPKSQSG